MSAIRFFFAVLFMVFSFSAQAEESIANGPVRLGIHLGTYHGESGFNSRNPGLYIRGPQGATIGFYCNSESRSRRYPDAATCKVSTYAGREWSWTIPHTSDQVSLMVGFLGGYDRGITPVVVPSLLVNDHLRVVIIPRLDPKTDTWGIHFAWEY